jgi:hypothetical protein
MSEISWAKGDGAYEGSSRCSWCFFGFLLLCEEEALCRHAEGEKGGGYGLVGCGFA